MNADAPEPPAQPSPAAALPVPFPDPFVAEVVEDVRDLVGAGVRLDAELVSAAVRGWSDNTRRAFRSDLTVWGDWCRRHGVVPARATPSHVAAFIRALSGIDPSAEEIRAMATIERYVSYIGRAYRLAGLPDPTSGELITFEKKAARKKRGVRQRQARAIRFKGDIADFDSPASGVCLAHLLKAVRRDEMGLRDEALMRVAYDVAARRSEVVAIDVDHIHGPDAQGAGALFIPSSKTDQEGEGAWGYLSPATMKAIARWREAARIDKGPLFRRIETHFDGSIAAIGTKRLHPNSINLIYKRLVQRAFDKKLLGPMSEAEVARWVAAVSSHSLRVGVAQDNFAAREPLPAIMQAYRWRDPKTVLRYGAQLAVKSGAAARMAARVNES
ncbi:MULTISPECIES: tyrosine-type recombinase/integrase [Alphaproteobacteria]|jgi:integrase|uniref:tyrosine-type recombinase/integrase n=1 Tax=Alphaproteobacteria TaxID=28211 RepID=UPI0006C8EA7E|nr:MULTISPECIES: tyrosine-type recombinase/integrase [Alphaproteobacteria]MBN05600.1 integrase [Ponticaulis sp.]PHR75959.1 MAG: integrase [Henriciella sp.]|tara:strand:+ start:8026 stop:9183 length:1158 start_codon:yes stop_codon:yes gene_type:complete